METKNTKSNYQSLKTHTYTQTSYTREYKLNVGYSLMEMFTGVGWVSDESDLQKDENDIFLTHSNDIPTIQKMVTQEFGEPNTTHQNGKILNHYIHTQGVNTLIVTHPNTLEIFIY